MNRRPDTDDDIPLVDITDDDLIEYRARESALDMLALLREYRQDLSAWPPEHRSEDCGVHWYCRMVTLLRRVETGAP